jgi:PPK2 family polyphosphate:nucleotide phosphotransferase
MFKAIESPYLVPFDETFKIRNADTGPSADHDKKKNHRKKLADCVEQLDQLQRILYAHDRHAILLIFQAMDAAGKDSTIRAVMSGVDPSGCQVFSFKQPSSKELDHDFLRRAAIRLPERGRIGVFNRSYYEEVLIVRVHPEILKNQKLPEDTDWENIWQHRYQSINSFEKHLARNGTVILKFWLNISREEQRRRFLSRLDEPEKNWKFSAGDVKERQYWNDYMEAYEAALNATSKPWAPWYAIPADDKGYLRQCVAEIVVDSLASLDLNYPKVAAEDLDRFEEMRNILRQEKE